MLGLLWEFQNDTEFVSLENLANSAAKRKPVSDMFGNFYLAKNHKIDDKATNTNAREYRFGILGC